ncbi:MAG: hypothetical protein JWO31_2816 [Phycisphaerales bacterium]|nr:hypothetical protein [Phycisphaerales bacterium]
MSGIRSFVIVAVVGWLGFAADVSQGALAKKAGGSGLSGTLSSNKAIRKQQLICDPDEPTGGSISVQYDPEVVGVSGFSFGPNYTGTAFVQLNFGDGSGFVPLTRYLAQDGSDLGFETGFIQVLFNEPTATTTAVKAAALLPHGQIPVAEGYTTIDTDGPAAVDTHSLTFNYLAGVADSTVAAYKIYAAEEGEYGNPNPDYLTGLDENGVPYTLSPSDIAWAKVSGSLNANAVPLPPAALLGGLTMAGMIATRKLRRRTA